MASPLLFHVNRETQDDGSWVQPGYYGAACLESTAADPAIRPERLGALPWEAALETARLAISPLSPSRLRCVFAAETFDMARIFRDRFRPGSGIYAVQPWPDAVLFRGNFGIVTDIDRSRPFLAYMPADALRYWSDPPGEQVEVLNPVRQTNTPHAITSEHDRCIEAPTMPIRDRVGRHARDGGRHCQNRPEDQQTIIAMLNRIPVSKGGAEGSITGRVISGVCSDALFSAIRKFEDANFPGRRRGFVDPDSAMLRLMEALSADKPAPVPPPAKPSPPPSAKRTIFTPGVMHNHQPTGRWTEVQNDPKSQFGLSTIARHGDPAAVMLAAGLAAMRDKPLAIKHLNWFVNEGNGRDFVENENLDLMLRTDAKIQAKIRSHFPKVQTSGVFAGHVAITQDDYEDEDFQYSFGEIDRLDFEADFSEGTFHAWFMDRYEWHPYYPSIYKVMDGDYLRPTNAVHAAAVEMKAGSARDFWMIGEVRIPLKAIQSAADKSDTVWVDPKPWY